MREFLSAKQPCNAGCKYCFANWTCNSRNIQIAPIFDKNSITKKVILYPCCDGDFFDQSDCYELIHQYARHYENIYVSLSSKLAINKEKIERLFVLNNELMSNNKGFVKFAISLSSKSMISEIEPETMPYIDRIETARVLSELGIPLSLTIKPVLPFITPEEYEEVILDFQPYLKHILLGGLYIDRTTSFFRDYHLDAFNIQNRKVSWLPGNPIWEYIENESQMQRIENFAIRQGLHVFFSDADIIRSMINEGEEA